MSIVPLDHLSGAQVGLWMTGRDIPLTSGAMATLMPSGIIVLNP